MAGRPVLLRLRHMDTWVAGRPALLRLGHMETWVAQTCAVGMSAWGNFLLAECVLLQAPLSFFASVIWKHGWRRHARWACLREATFFLAECVLLQAPLAFLALRL